MCKGLCAYLPFDELRIGAFGIGPVRLDGHQTTVRLRNGYERLMAVRYGVLSDGVIARQVARIQPRVVRRLKHASLLVTVAEYPRTVRALHQFAHVKRFVHPWREQKLRVEIGRRACEYERGIREGFGEA